MGQQWGQKRPVCFDKETKKDGDCWINCGRNEIPNLRVVGSSPIERARVSRHILNLRFFQGVSYGAVTFF